MSMHVPGPQSRAGSFKLCWNYKGGIQESNGSRSTRLVYIVAIIPKRQCMYMSPVKS